MESYNSILRYFFPILFFLQYLGCDSYRSISNYDLNSVDASATAVTAEEAVVEDDCTTLKAYNYNGFYKSVTDGKLFKKKEGEYFTDSLLVSKLPVIDFTEFKSVNKGYDAAGYPTIEVSFTENGTQLFKEHTANNVGEKLAVIIKDELIVAPVIHSEIPGGQVVISGSFTQSEANKMYTYLSKVIRCVKRN